MRNSTQLLSVSALALALGGCSMAGTGDWFADHHGQSAQSSQYWGGEQSSCHQAPAPAPVSNPCEVSYPVAPQHVQTHNYGAPAAPQAYGPAVPQQQVYQGQTYQNQGYAGHQGQPAYQHGEYAPGAYAPAYVGAQGGSSKGLRQSYTYANLGATLYDVDSDLYGVLARAGWQSKGLFGAEVEGSFGVSDDDATVVVGGVPLAAETEVETQLAGFGVVRYPVSNKFTVLGRVGYHNTDINGTVTDAAGVTQDVEFSTDGIAYGAGVEYALNPLTGLRADYTRYDLDGADADAVSLAVTRKF